MTYPWRRAVSQARNYIDSQNQETRRNVIVGRQENEAAKPNFAPGKITPEDRTSIALGVTFAVLILAAVAGACWYFFVRKRQKPADIEKGKDRNWFMVDAKGKGEKGGLSEWWRKSYAVPDRVEPPSSAGPRSSLQRLRSALAGRSNKKSNDESIPSPPANKAITSPTMTIVLPMQTVPQVKPRYPSVLERGYRVPLYPTAVQAQDNAPSRSLTSPAPQQPITAVAERPIRRSKVSIPPRALKISNGRPLVSIAERRLGVPRSPAHRRKGAGLIGLGQFKHPFIPLKDSDTDFPTISGPFPSSETGETNPKLSYDGPRTSAPRAAPALYGPRVSRASSRRVPVPIVINSAPIRPLMPATPRHLREETRILPPGQSPTVPRPAPTPL